MNEKELWVHFLAYNLIPSLMAQAAANAAVHPRPLVLPEYGRLAATVGV